MWKIVVVLLLTALAILLAHLAYRRARYPDPFGRVRLGHSRRRPELPCAFLMYAGVRR